MAWKLVTQYTFEQVNDDASGKAIEDAGVLSFVAARRIGQPQLACQLARFGRFRVDTGSYTHYYYSRR